MTDQMQGFEAAFGALLTLLLGFEAFFEGEKVFRGLILLGSAGLLGWSAWTQLIS